MAENTDMGDGSSTVWVLIEPTLDQQEQQLRHYAGARKFSAEKLGDLLHEFTASLSEALDKVQNVPASYELNSVTVNAQLMGELGFALVATAGVAAGIELHFERKK